MQTSPLEQNQGPFSFTSTTKLNHPCFFSSPVKGEKQLPSYQVKYEHHAYCSRNILAENLPSSNCLNLQRVISSSAVGILKVFDCKSETKEPLWIQVLAIHSQNTISLFHFLRRNGNHPPWRHLVLKAKPKNSHCPQSTCFSPGHPAEKNARGTAYGQHAQFFLSSGKGTQWHRFLQNLNLAEEDNRRQSKGKQWTRTGLMVPSEPSSLPHSSGSSLQRPAYWQTTHTHRHRHRHTRPRDDHCWPWTWGLRRMEGGRWRQSFQVSRTVQPLRAGRQAGWGHHLCEKTVTAGRAPWSVTGGHQREVFLCQHGVLAQAGDWRVAQAATCPLSSPGQFHKELRERQTNASCCVRQASVRVRDKAPRGKGTRCRDFGARGPIFCLCPDCPSAESSPWRVWRDVHASHLDLSHLSWQRNQLIIPWQGYKSCEAHQAVAFCNSSEWLKWCLILN